MENQLEMNFSLFDNYSVVDFNPAADYNRVVLVTVVLSIIALVGTVGNVLVALVVFCDEEMRSPYNILLTNLALANLLFLVLCIPTHILQHTLYKWPLGDVLCKVIFFMIFVSVYVEVYTLVVLCISRFLAVQCPVKFARLDTKQNALIVCATIWLIFLLCNVSLLPEYKEYYLEKDTSVCVHQGAFINFSKLRLLWTSFFLFACVLPLMSVCGLSVIILYTLQYPTGVNYDHLSGGDCARKRKMTILVIIVIVVFSLCWLPLQILMMVDIYAMPDWVRSFEIAEVVCVCLAYSNASLNPVIYFVFLPEYRLAFEKLLCCDPRSRINLRRSGYSQKLQEETSLSTM